MGGSEGINTQTVKVKYFELVVVSPNAEKNISGKMSGYTCTIDVNHLAKRTPALQEHQCPGSHCKIWISQVSARQENTLAKWLRSRCFFSPNENATFSQPSKPIPVIYLIILNLPLNI